MVFPLMLALGLSLGVTSAPLHLLHRPQHPLHQLLAGSRLHSHSHPARFHLYRIPLHPPSTGCQTTRWGPLIQEAALPSTHGLRREVGPEVALFIIEPGLQDARQLPVGGERVALFGVSRFWAGTEHDDGSLPFHLLDGGVR